MSDTNPTEDGAEQQTGRQHDGADGSSQSPAQQESITDIFSKPNTKNQLKAVVVLYAAVGVGIGISVFMLMQSVQSGGFGGSIIGFAGVVSAAVVGPALGGPIGLHVTSTLRGEEKTDMIFATAGVGAFGGHVLMLIIASIIIFTAASSTSGSLGEVFVPIIIGGLGAAVAAVGSAYAGHSIGQRG